MQTKPKFYGHATIGSHFLPAIFNDDYTGLTDEEATQIDLYLASLVKEVGGVYTLSLPSDIDSGEYLDTDEFGLDEVTSLWGNVVKVAIFVNLPK